MYFHELLEFSGPDSAHATEDLQDRLSSAVAADLLSVLAKGE